MARRGRSGSRLLGIAVVVAGPACHSTQYVPAAVGLGAAVAMAGVNRAITHDCWARCSPGYYCDEASGLCEQGECIPPCTRGQSCVRDLEGGLVCANDPTSHSLGDRSDKVYSKGPGPRGGDPVFPSVDDAGITDAGVRDGAGAAGAQPADRDLDGGDSAVGPDASGAADNGAG